MCDGKLTMVSLTWLKLKDELVLSKAEPSDCWAASLLTPLDLHTQFPVFRRVTH